MSSGISSGNYPCEIWDKTRSHIENKDFPAWRSMVFTNPPKGIKPPFFLLIDIHGFSNFCMKMGKKGKNKEVSNLLTTFFHRMSEQIHRDGGKCIKFIGDAILATHTNKKEITQLGNNLIERFNGDFKKSFPKTDVVVLLCHPRECLKGFVGGSDYVDYSYWASGLNFMFHKAKELEEGHVWYIRRDEVAVNYDRFPKS